MRYKRLTPRLQHVILQQDVRLQQPVQQFVDERFRLVLDPPGAFGVADEHPDLAAAVVNEA